jgi:hypothetical protein
MTRHVETAALAARHQSRIHQRSKRLLFGLGVIVLPLGITSLAQAQSGNIAAYACEPGQGTVHLASDLKGGDLRKHQTADGFTCYEASKPSGSDGSLSCTSPSALHLVSDLANGVLPKHQEGSPPKTCIEGNLPICNGGYIAINPVTHLVGQMTPDAVCTPNPK